MKPILSELCTAFIQNRDTLKDTFRWESAYMIPVCAATFTNKRKTAAEGELKSCAEILKKKTGIFSNFRGYIKLSMISLMAVSEGYEQMLNNALTVYQSLKEHFSSSSYLPLASMIIAEMAEPMRYDEIAVRARQIYELMKKEHPFLTSGEDSVFAALLALSNQGTEQQITEETERCYTLLKREFSGSNAVQSLSHVLALGEESAAKKCERTISLYYKLKEKGLKYGTNYELATLGVLALIPADLNEIVQEVSSVDAFLSEQKGYGILGVGKKQRLMHASMLVASAFTSEQKDSAMNPAAISGAVSLIIAQEIAICAAIAASAAASSASN